MGPPSANPSIGIIGRGRFGAYWARQLELAGHSPKMWDVLDGPGPALSRAAGCEVVYFTVPIRAQREAVRIVAPHMRPGAIAVDACTVKVLPLKWMRQDLPLSVEAVGVHHLFGPQSAPDTCHGQRVVVCEPRTPDSDRVAEMLTRDGLEVIRCTPEQHDHQIAYSQLLTHFIGRSIDAFNRSKRLELSTLLMATITYRDLMDIKDVVCGNSYELFEDMNTFNPYAAEARRELLAQLHAIDDQLRAASPA